MSSNTETILIYTILAGLLSIVYGFFTGKQILNASSGNDKMRDIASAIQIGAKAYLNRQYKTSHCRCCCLNNNQVLQEY